MKHAILFLLAVTSVSGFTQAANAAGVAMCSLSIKNKSNIDTDLPFSDDMFLLSNSNDISGHEVNKELTKRVKTAFPPPPYPACKSSKGNMEYGYYIIAKSDYVKDYKGNEINKIGFGVGKDRPSAVLALEKHLKLKNISSHKMKKYMILREDKFGNWPTGMPTGKPKD